MGLDGGLQAQVILNLDLGKDGGRGEGEVEAGGSGKRESGMSIVDSDLGTPLNRKAS